MSRERGLTLLPLVHSVIKIAKGNSSFRRVNGVAVTYSCSLGDGSVTKVAKQ